MRKRVAVAVISLVGLTSAACGKGSDTTEVDADAPTASAVTGATSVASSGSTDATSESQGSIAPVNGSGDVVEVLNRAAQRVSDTTSGQFSMVMTMSGMPDVPGDVEMTMSGAFDRATSSSRMSMDLSSFAEAAAASGEELGSMGAMFGSPIEVVQIDTVSYTKMGFLNQMFGLDADQWVRGSGGAGSTFGDFSDFGSGADSPEQFAQFLTGAGIDVTKVGDEELDGVDTIHLHGVANVSDLLDAEPERAELEGAAGELLSGIDDLGSYEFDVWVSDDGVLHKMVIVFEGGEGELSGARITIEMTMTNWGEPVTITAPADFVDESELESLFGTFDPEDFEE